MPPLETRIHLDMLARSRRPGVRRRLQLARQRDPGPRTASPLGAGGPGPAHPRRMQGALFGYHEGSTAWSGGDPDEIALPRATSATIS